MEETKSSPYVLRLHLFERWLIGTICSQHLGHIFFWCVPGLEQKHKGFSDLPQRSVLLQLSVAM